MLQEQIHLNKGLNKIQETEKQVTELQKSLNENKVDLKQKREAASAKLQQILRDQSEAENEKRLAEKLEEQIKEEKQKMDVKKAQVEKELAEVIFWQKTNKKI
jgi:dynein heavy chain 1